MDTKVIDGKSGDETKRRNPLTRCERLFLASYGTYRKLMNMQNSPRWFVHSGLFSIMTLYLMGGAFIFKDLEAKGEKAANMSCDEARENLIKNLWNASKGNFEGFSKESKRLLGEMEEGCQSSGDDNNNWSFLGAFFYSLSIVTTIGYGRILPKTLAGRWISILYTFGGIPLFNLFLNNLVSLYRRWLSSLFKGLFWLATSCCKVVCSKSKNKIEVVSDNDDDGDVDFPFSYAAIFVTFVLCGSAVFSSVDSSLSFFDAFLSLFMALATVSFGEAIPKTIGLLMAGLLFYTIGLAMNVLCFGAIENKLSQVFNRILEKKTNQDLEASIDEEEVLSDEEGLEV